MKSNILIWVTLYYDIFSLSPFEVPSILLISIFYLGNYNVIFMDINYFSYFWESSKWSLEKVISYC